MGGAKNCPETPRQKMIGMMYLVLTAMLALNVSTDVLNGFTLVDDSLHSSIDASNNRNVKLYNEFKVAAQQNPEKVELWYNKAQNLQILADSLYNYIQDFKTQIVILADGAKKVNERTQTMGDPTRLIEGNSNTDVTGQYAITEGHGATLKTLIETYRDYIIEIGSHDEVWVSGMKQRFYTGNIWNTHMHDSITWEQAIFEGMPVGATVTVLTKIQNDIRATESMVIQHLMSRVDANDLRVNKLSAYIIPQSNYVMKGSRYSAQIILAAVDSTQRPIYYVDGKPINEHGHYEVVANTIGLHKFTGQIAYKNPATGEVDYLPFENEYRVVEPSVTISNEELNILYRGYNNRFSISVPGVSNDRLTVNVTNASIKHTNESWIIKPNENAKEVLVSVYADLEGKKQAMGARTYRVKALPKPAAYFVSRDVEYQEGNIARSALLDPKANIVASYGPDGLLDLPFNITSFKVNINGIITGATGNKFSKDQLNRLNKLKKGALVVITDIRAKGPDGKEIRLSPIPLSLN